MFCCFLAAIRCGLVGGCTLGLWLAKSVPGHLGKPKPRSSSDLLERRRPGSSPSCFIHRKFHATHEPKFGAPGGSAGHLGNANLPDRPPSFINTVSYGWQFLMDLLGVPVERQEMVDLLTSTHSWRVKMALIVLACVAAPIVEEIVFRAGLFGS